MNEKWEKKKNSNEKAKELYLQYKAKETQIKDMLKTYGKMKEEGAKKEELAILKETIKREQVKLLENFNEYKNFPEEVDGKAKKEQGLKLISIKRPKTRAKRNVKLMSMKKSDDGIKIIPLSRSELIKRKATRTRTAARKRNSTAKIISMTGEKRKITNRKQKHFTKRKIRRVKKQLSRKYRVAKARGKYRINRKLKAFKRGIRKKVRVFQKSFKSNKVQNTNKRKIESPRRQRKERKLTLINIIDNTDGHIEANANEKIRKMPDEDKKQGNKELHVIGW